ncbi:MAG TPA: hypothetical protein VKY89_18400 [Thermoanaerobaculia bacterium]|nr:hypothetical protein [Thermoanaerobaculia bacterium]
MKMVTIGVRFAGPLVLAVALAAPAAWAHQAAAGGMAPPAPAAMAPMAPMAPTSPPAPSPVLEQVKWFAGDWQCTGTGYMAGKGHPTTAKVHMAWDLGGYFMGLRYEESKSAANPMPVSAVEHWGFSEERKMLIAGQLDSMGGYGTRASGGWQGDTLTWVGETHMMGTTMVGRDTFVKHGDDEVTHLGEVQMNGAWTKQDEETCHRVSK